VTPIVAKCTDTTKGLTGAGKDPWMVRKTIYVASLD
jgi:hypothetical protein